jgi:hypothetical protein
LQLSRKSDFDGHGLLQLGTEAQQGINASTGVGLHVQNVKAKYSNQ